MNKYKNRKTELDGHLFDSKKEAERYAELKLLARAGVIQGLQLQPVFTLQNGFTDNKGHRHRPITYRADFCYQEDGALVVEDVKGFETDVFKIKKKLFMYKYPEIDFRVER